MQDEHDDLLSLVAQQEVELDVFKTTLQSKSGTAAVEEAAQRSKQTAVDRYGSYIDFR